MTFDQFTTLLNSIAGLVGAVAWPLVAVFALLLFAKPISDFVASINEFSLNGGGIGLSAKRKTEAAAALGAAIAKQPDLQEPEAIAQQLRKASQIVDAVSPQTAKEANKATVLWVDDVPSNNTNERRALEALGVTFVLATSTEEALRKINKESFKAIISDLGRPEGRTAGFTLLEKLRVSENQTPFIIYAGSAAVAFRDEAMNKGAFGCTNRPDQLFDLVLSAIRSSR